jgi:uncharacterized protein YndB with AHSA1/START domain
MTFKFEFTIDTSPSIVFKAITTKRGYQGWWTKVCDVDCKLNGTSSIRFEKEDIIEEMIFQTIEIKPNRRLVWLCTSNNVFESWINTTLHFEIHPKGKRTLFAFTQIGTDKNWKKHPDFSATQAGWEMFMGSLKSYCESGEGHPWE